MVNKRVAACKAETPDFFVGWRGVLPTMDYAGRLCLKGYLFWAGGIENGRDLMS